MVLPLALGAFILVWVYRGFDFARAAEVLRHGMDYGWMAATLVFGILSHVVRGIRWRLALEPLGERPRMADCVYAIFVSYAANLVVPRVGEVSRCGVLARYDGVSFAKSLGTVVTERLIDTLCVCLLTGLALVLQLPVFDRFFRDTGAGLGALPEVLASADFYIVLLCAAGIGALLWRLLRTYSFFAKVKDALRNVWAGALSLRRVRKRGLFLAYTALIWLCYYLQFYLSFYCFGFSEGLGPVVGLVLFVVGSIAVVVPTPNGAGPWHFGVITMMMLYGVGQEDAGVFALLVHGVQTLLVVVLGIYGLIMLSFTNRRRKYGNNQDLGSAERVEAFL